MKKKLFTGAMAAICLSVSAYGTIAFFTAENTANNVITAGNIKIDLQEKADSGDGNLTDFKDVTGVMPGTEVSKIVQVENTGDKDAYIRIKVDKALELAGNVQGESDLSLVTMDYDTRHWTLDDGYYYYNAPLSAGETTEPLFTEVIFSKDMGDMYQNSKVTITVDAAATQVDNNGDSALTADGWPAD